MMTVVFAIVLSVAQAQAAPPPPPPPPPTPPPSRAAVPALLPIGNAVITGTVVSPGDTPQPIARATVTITSVATGAAASVITDDSGQFVVERLGAGEYHVTATKAAYLSMAWRASRPGQPGSAVVVTDGQRFEGVRIALPKGAVISGRLTMPNGTPLADTEVRAVPVTTAPVGGVGTQARTFLSDDQGHFRIFGLSPGRYLVAAYPAVGRGEVDLTSADDYDRLAALAARPATTPAPTSAATATTAPPRRVGTYAPTYYPGTPAAGDAMVVTVTAGDERLGVDIPIVPVRTTEIYGVILDADGRPTQAVQMEIIAAGPPRPVGSTIAIRSVRPDADGHFAFTNVPPGLYRIVVRAGGVSLQGNSGMTINTANNTLWAQADVRVDGEPPPELRLQLREGERLSGRVRVADGETAPTSWGAVQVGVQALRETGVRSLSTVQSTTSQNERRSATADAEGTFTVTGIVPALYEPTTTLPAALAGWHVAELRHNGRDLRDGPLTFADGSLSGVEVILSRRQASLSGRFSTESGTPVLDYSLVVFPEDRALWHTASPRIRVTRPSAEGRFTIVGLPPGTYRLAAVDDMDDNDRTDREFLDSIYEAAVRITIVAGQETRQDLRIR